MSPEADVPHALVDAHADLTHLSMYEEAIEALGRAAAVGISDLVMVGTDPDSWTRQVALAKRVGGVHCTFGWHPWWISELGELAVPAVVESLEGAIDAGGPVAVGEIGLDFSRPHWKAAALRQRTVLREQLAIARSRDLPVVLHAVRAHGALVEVLKGDGLPAAGGMIHGFTGSPEAAQDLVRIGLHVSFSANLANPAFLKARRASVVVPSERLLVETDCPDQSVRGTPGAGRPRELPEVVKCLATLRNTDVEQVRRQTAENARRLFRLPGPPQGSTRAAET